MKGFITLGVVLAVATLAVFAVGGSLWMAENNSVGATRIFTSSQVGTNPTNGDCLTTDGTDSEWTTDCGSGGGGGSSPDQYVSATDSIEPIVASTSAHAFYQADHFVATSTATSSTFVYASSTAVTATNFWGLVSLATALNANGSNCSAGNFPLGVDALGVVETCTDAWTEAENTSAAYISNITGESIFDLSDVSGSSAASGTLLVSDGTNFNARATSTLGLNVHDSVTLAGTPDYITISGQVITRNTVDISDDTNLTAGDALTLTGDDIDFDGGTAPGGELGGTWGSPSIDDSLAVTSWNLTTPTLISFFGTPCSGNEFLQDISDTGAFTCAEAAGGAGSTSGGWATTTATTTQPAEVVTYTATDILSGGSAYNTAEVVIDHNRPFILLSTTTRATTTVMNLDDTQTVSLGIGTTTDHTTDPILTKWFDFVYTTTNQVIMMARTGVTTFVHDFAVIFNSTATFLSTITFDSETFDSLTDDATLANNAGDLQVVDVTCTDCLNATEIEDIYLLDDGDVGTGNYDFGGATFFEIPNGTGPTADDPGEIAHDTTDNQLILDDRVIRTSEEIFKTKIASTTALGIGASSTFPVLFDGYTATDIACYVEGGTSKVIHAFGETITCATTVTQDDGAIASGAVAALATTSLELGTGSGTWNWLNITVNGVYTRE